MVARAVKRRLGRMTIQAIGRVGACCYSGHNFYSRAVMTGGAGTGSVGGNIMLGTIYFSPVRHNVTIAAGKTTRNVSGIQCNGMCMRCMGGVKTAGVAGGAVAAGGEVLTNCRTDQPAIHIVTASAAVMGLGCCAD